jgi:hypothetical protein
VLLHRGNRTRNARLDADGPTAEVPEGRTGNRDASQGRERLEGYFRQRLEEVVPSATVRVGGSASAPAGFQVRLLERLLGWT